MIVKSKLPQIIAVRAVFVSTELASFIPLIKVGRENEAVALIIATLIHPTVLFSGTGLVENSCIDKFILFFF